MKVLIHDDWSDEAKEIVRPYMFNGGDPVWETNGIITSLDSRYPAAELAAWPNLRFLASATTGLDHIDVGYCNQRGIEIISLQGETEFLRDVWATAEHTMALILSLVRRIPWAYDDVKQGNWERERWQGSELRGKTLGIIGYGRVGQQVAKFAEVFGMRVIYSDVEGKALKYLCAKRDLEYRLECRHSLKYLLFHSDIITVHVPLTDETKGMFSYEQFAQMKPTSYFVNTSRGAVVDENALLHALVTGQIAGAAVDVVCNEPQLSRSMRDYAKHNKNLIITPHLGGQTAESRSATQIFIANKIKEFIEQRSG